ERSAGQRIATGRKAPERRSLRLPGRGLLPPSRASFQEQCCGRANGCLSEPLDQAVERAGEPLAADGVGAQERELPLARKAERRHGEPDEPDGLAENDAVEQCARLPVDREPILG